MTDEFIVFNRKEFNRWWGNPRVGGTETVKGEASPPKEVPIPALLAENERLRVAASVLRDHVPWLAESGLGDDDEHPQLACSGTHEHEATWCSTAWPCREWIKAKEALA